MFIEGTISIYQGSISSGSGVANRAERTEIIEVSRRKLIGIGTVRGKVNILICELTIIVF